MMPTIAVGKITNYSGVGTNAVNVRDFDPFVEISLISFSLEFV